MSSAAARAPRLTLVNLATQDTLEAQFNPTEFEEALGVIYARHTVPGLSHTVKHFVNTDDVKFKLTLFQRAETIKELELIKAARVFLYAACHPRKVDALIKGGAPKLLFVWPKTISLAVVITGLKFRYTQFNREGDPVSWEAACDLEELRESVVTMEDIITQGTIRSSAKGGA